MMKRTQRIAIAACLALVACGTQGAKSSSTAAVDTHADSTVAHVGQPAPGWTEMTSTGSTLALSSLRGKAVYLNFFATWCPPCNDEAASLNALQKQYGDRGLQIVGVDVLENAVKTRQFVDGHHLIYPAVVDPGDLRDQYDVNGLPVHAFIGRDGVVRNIIVGELSPEDMRANVERILH